MSINFTELFTETGFILGIINALNTERGTTVPGYFNDLYTQFQTDGKTDTIDGYMSSLTSWQGSNASILSSLASLASANLIATVNADTPQPDKTLATAMAELISQMQANSQTVKASVVGISGTSGGSNTGNPVFVYSTKTKTGLALENLFAETITGETTSDSQTGGVSAGSETITFQGQYAQTDRLAYDYPKGSGSTLALTLVDASLDEPGGYSQWLQNGNFETFTVANTPDHWTITVGTAGTQVLESTAQHYDGSASVSFVGDSSTLTAIEQEFSVDNTSVILPYDQYAVNLWVKCDSIPVSGVLEIALCDGSGTIIQDAQGNDNKITENLSSLTTSWAAINGVFRTPRVLPTAVNLRIRFSTACPTGTTVFMDRLAFARMYQLYQGGPYVSGFSGSTATIDGDTYTITTTNTRGKFQLGFQQLFNMMSLQMLLPSSGSPTQADALVTT